MKSKAISDAQELKLECIIRLPRNSIVRIYDNNKRKVLILKGRYILNPYYELYDFEYQVIDLHDNLVIWIPETYITEIVRIGGPMTHDKIADYWQYRAFIALLRNGWEPNNISRVYGKRAWYYRNLRNQMIKDTNNAQI